MACCQPLLIPNYYYSTVNNGTARWQEPYIEVPCGWCLNCRIDKCNWYSDALEYEYKKAGYIGSFVTVTYDDIHIQENTRIDYNSFMLTIDDKEKEIWANFYAPEVEPDKLYSLRREDGTKFIKRIRSKIKYLYDNLSKIGDKYNIDSFNSDLIRKDFKVFWCGEYGDVFGRCHMHFVFIGLDFQYCYDIFKSCWKGGLIDVLPIKDGCFDYVTKYLIKQVHGKLAKELFDDNNLERPWCAHSLGLGKGLILEQLDFIRSHNGCYLTKNNLYRPVPIYYKGVLKIRTKPDFTYIHNAMLQDGFTPDFENNSQNIFKGLKNQRFSFKRMNEYRHKQAVLRAERLLEISRANGIYPEVFDIGYDYKFNHAILEPFSDYSNSLSVEDSLEIEKLANLADLSQVPF